ncbi:peptidoglycan bridge formation glycyltransferase FemA/FemB family protein [Paenibacillus sp. FJAT-26967]|uniref:lipid II:glycine glycyltransferase FemX n=1 Tax=Paenibacillus sp. FJAT-26967 TaxID=1729690 RepID=UPI00083955AF|nr:peptidoglycan bridge formation glycyltransferase FemA/FemB family protein [Paenibacillus sp. FJAT-26967]
MKFTDQIDAGTFDNFVLNSYSAHFMQTTAWAELKRASGWQMRRVGVMNGDRIAGASLVLLRPIPRTRYSIGYAPRGYLLDYSDARVVEEMTRGIREWARKQRIVFLILDPELVVAVRDNQQADIELGGKPDQAVERMKKLGYLHDGDELDFNGVQPRFTFQLPLGYEESVLMDGFHRKTLYNIRLAARKGVEIVKGTEADIGTFAQIMAVTGKRDGFVTRDADYFKRLYRELHPAGLAELYVAKINPSRAIEHLKKGLEQARQEAENLDKRLAKDAGNLAEEDKLAEITSKLEILKSRIAKYSQSIAEMEEIKLSHPEGLVVSGAIETFAGKTAWYVYGASDNVFRDYMPNYLLQWEMIREAKRRGCTTYDFGGISGDVSPDNPLWGLYAFKKGFGGQFVEFAGEFTYVFNRPLYKLWTTVFPMLRSVRKRLMSLRRS